MFWVKKWSPDFWGIFRTFSRIVQSRKNGTYGRLDLEETNAAKLCEVRALGLDYCSLVVQAGHHELDIEKEEKGASEDTLKRQLRVTDHSADTSLIDLSN